MPDNEREMRMFRQSSLLHVGILELAQASNEVDYVVRARYIRAIAKAIADVALECATHPVVRKPVQSEHEHAVDGHVKVG